MLNCFVHTIMYTYYMLSAFGERVRKYLWWKKYVTVLQMVRKSRNINVNAYDVIVIYIHVATRILVRIVWVVATIMVNVQPLMQHSNTFINSIMSGGDSSQSYYIMFAEILGACTCRGGARVCSFQGADMHSESL